MCQDRTRDLEDKLRTVRRTLGHAAKAFRLYADLHRAKATPEAERKAVENSLLAEEMERALEDTEPGNILKGPVFIQNDFIHGDL